MFDAYIRKAVEGGKIIFPEDFCFRWEKPEDEGKKALEDIEAQLGPYQYAGNYLNNPVADELVEFKPEWFQQFQLTREMNEKLRGAKCLISVDPATRLKESNDPTGIVVTKIDSDGYVYIVEAYAKRFRPNELIDEIFRLNGVYQPDQVIIETVSSQILWVPLLQEKMRKENTRFRLVEYDPGTKDTKAIKIRKLIPFYARGQVFHRSNLLELERQLSEFPRNRHDDIIDALQSQVESWKGRTVVKTKPAEKFTRGWWDELRRLNPGRQPNAEQNLFREYQKRPSTVVRRPTW